MKKFAIVQYILVLSLVACSTVPTINEGKQVAETLIKEADKGNYEALSEYYTTEFNQGEPESLRVEKFKQLKEAFGDLQEIQMIDSATVSEEGVILKFLVKHTKLNSIETFVVVKEENKSKVAKHMVKNE